METIESLKKRLDAEKNPTMRNRIADRIEKLKNENNSESELITNEKIENKEKLTSDILKLKKLYNLSKDDDILADLKVLESELKKITDLELKLYAYHERESIMTEKDGVLTEEIKSVLQSSKFPTELNAKEISEVSYHYIPKGMCVTEDGFLVGLEAKYGIENCTNPYRYENA